MLTTEMGSLLSEENLCCPREVRLKKGWNWVESEENNLKKKKIVFKIQYTFHVIYMFKRVVYDYEVKIDIIVSFKEWIDFDYYLLCIQYVEQICQFKGLVNWLLSMSLVIWLNTCYKLSSSNSSRVRFMLTD